MLMWQKWKVDIFLYAPELAGLVEDKLIGALQVGYDVDKVREVEKSHLFSLIENFANNIIQQEKRICC